MLQELKVIQWNCNRLLSKFDLFLHFLSLQNPDIVLLNELKMTEIECNYYSNIIGYESIFKPRPMSRPGSLGLDFSFDVFNIESLSILVKIKDKKVSISTLYNPPNQTLQFDFFQRLSELRSNVIIGGDLNSKSTLIGCKNQNNNGNILEKIIHDLNFYVINDSSTTFHRNINNYEEILDIFLCSSNIAELISSFGVYDEDLTIDHYPTWINISTDKLITRPNFYANFNLKRANWKNFKDCLDTLPGVEYKSNSDLMCSEITMKILNAAEKTLPKTGQKIFKIRLHPEIVKLIKERRKLRRKYFRSRSNIDKTEFNKITARVKLKIKDFKNKNWEDFANKNKRLSRSYWRRINKFRNSANKSKIPTLILDKKEFATDEEKSIVFGERLSEIFKNNEDKSDLVSEMEVENLVTNFFSSFPELPKHETITPWFR
ncbi:RNA-directed DNA polymerase from mobile element jockey-like [Brachionus plicatilis]|uniref:RNA-directed DNA polymerase from mobile element jockey-like n=1 Tax=Brachionus plicatilis TaxID=10195 RepID=A0A3M7PUP7_BRAPC|nr:RNA-directed DNA polymerase from mobile element jockey-like [Brachionus plicatilis]